MPPGTNTGTRRQRVATVTISRGEKRLARSPVPDFDTMALTALYVALRNLDRWPGHVARRLIRGARGRDRGLQRGDGSLRGG
jgi:hypothetical protein